MVMNLRDDVYVKVDNFYLMKVNVAMKKGRDKHLSHFHIPPIFKNHYRYLPAGINGMMIDQPPLIRKLCTFSP